jgi:hypothetical protein
MAVGPKIGMKLMSMLIGIPVGILTKKVVERTWVAARPQEPPRKPADPRTGWGDAIGWAALSAAGVVAAEMITRRSAEATYRKVIGSEPPPPKPTKAEKKLAQAAEKAGVTEET